MALIKNFKSDLRKKYKLFFEISLITSLVLVIAAFKFFPDIRLEDKKIEVPQELFTVEDIQQTLQESSPPPPPPRPQVVIASPTDEILQDIEISSSELDVAETVAPPPPILREEKKTIVEEEPQYFVAVEEMPQPIGGISAIQKLIEYPEIAKRAGIEGTVYILAFLDESGVVVKTQIVKGIGGGCDEAAANAVKMSKFNPGKQRGKPVKVQVMIPVRFQLDDKHPLS